MKLFVGLGNPGPSYKLNRHNIGFLFIEALARAYNFSDFKTKNKARYAEGKIDGQKCLIILPQTYMNLSGEAVTLFKQFHKIDLSDIIVFHDELDLPAGKIRVKRGGGAGGHNGLKSLDQYIGADYWRVRIGVGRPPEGWESADYVLSNFSAEEWQEIYSGLFENMLGALPLLWEKTESEFMNKVTLAGQKNG